MLRDETPLQRGDLMVAVNDAIAEAAAALDGRVGHDRWSFHCECDAIGCAETIALPLPEFARRRAAGEGVFADGHGPAGVA